MAAKKALICGLVVAGAFLVQSVCSAAPLMVDKNVFSQDRKPPAPESPSPTLPGKAGMPINNIQLDGVIINGNVKKALIRLKGQAPGTVGHPDKKKPQSPFVTIRENQEVSDFRVVKIETKSISLEKEGQVYTIDLFSTGKVVVPAAAAVPQPAPAAPNQPGAPPSPVFQPGVSQGGAIRGQPGQQTQAPVQLYPHNPNEPMTDPAMQQQMLQNQANGVQMQVPETDVSMAEEGDSGEMLQQ